MAFVLLLLVLLMLWPAQMLRTIGDEMDAKRYRLKGELLIEALNRELPASQVIEEKEINAHLRKIVAAQPAQSGFAAQLATASTVVIASGTGLPISTTQTLVGAIMGVGLARGIAAINLGVVRNIVVSWVITLPAGALLAIVIFYLLRWMFL